MKVTAEPAAKFVPVAATTLPESPEVGSNVSTGAFSVSTNSTPAQSRVPVDGPEHVGAGRVARGDIDRHVERAVRTAASPVPEATSDEPSGSAQ